MDRERDRCIPLRASLHFGREMLTCQSSVTFICSEFVPTLHHDCFFLSINTIPRMQVYPLWVIEGYLRGCVTSLFVYTMLSKQKSRVSKPLWHTNYCCVHVFFSHRQCGRVPEQQHYSHNVTKICFYLEMKFASFRLSSGPKHMHIHAHTVTHTFLKSFFVTVSFSFIMK